MKKSMVLAIMALFAVASFGFSADASSATATKPADAVKVTATKAVKVKKVVVKKEIKAEKKADAAAPVTKPTDAKN